MTAKRPRKTKPIAAKKKVVKKVEANPQTTVEVGIPKPYEPLVMQTKDAVEVTAVDKNQVSAPIDEAEPPWTSTMMMWILSAISAIVIVGVIFIWKSVKLEWPF